MLIYHHNLGTLTDLNEQPFALEKDIQTLFEQNLTQISGLQFIKSEFTIKNHRIDTLAFDNENKSFVIIEYKKDKNYSVIDQGVSYLNLMLEYKSDFIVEYNETQKTHLKRSEVDWSQSKVIFVSPSFTQFQKQSSNFKDFAIELWEIKRFENDIIVLNPIKKSASAPSIQQIKSKDSDIANITKQIIAYDEAYHLDNKTDDIKELYETYKTAILNLSDDIIVDYLKWYIAFKKKYNFVYMHIQKNALKIWINLKIGQLDDPKNLAKDVSNVGHWGNGDYEIIVKDTENLEYIMSLIKQAIKLNKKSNF